MKSTLQTLCLFLATVTYVYLLKAQVGESTYVPARCMCPNTEKKIRGPFSGFRVTEKGPSCARDEIIVILKNKNQPACLSPTGDQGKRLLKCYRRMTEKGKDTKRCQKRLRLQKKRQRKQHFKPKRVTP